MEKYAPTQKAIDALKSGKHWRDLASARAKNSLGSFLMNQLYLKDVSAGTVSELAGLHRATLYKILNGDTHPTRNVLLRLSRVLDMDMEKTQELLKLADVPMLSGSKKADLIIMYGIINKLSISDIDDDLVRNACPGLYSK